MYTTKCAIILGNTKSRVINLSRIQFFKLREKIAYFDDDGFLRASRWVKANRKDQFKIYMIDPDGFFPTGVLHRIQHHLSMETIGVELLDNRVVPKINTIRYSMKCSEPPAYDDQAKCTAALLKAGQGIGVMATGCLTGDAVIIYNKGGGSKIRRLDFLFKKYNGDFKGHPGFNGLDYSKRGKVRSLIHQTGIIGLNQVLNFVQSGVKDVYKLSLLDGKSLKGTICHPIMTDRGFVAIGDLIAGVDKVMTDTPRAIPSDRSKKKINNIWWCGIKYHPQHVQVDGVRGISLRVSKHKASYEANANSLSLDEYLHILRNDEQKASELNFVPRGSVVHHIDSDHNNNDPKNLQAMTNKEHCQLHAKINKKNFNQGIPKFVLVGSIEYAGKEMTYDIQCKAPNHNFVANGIVVHNSGKTRVIKDNIQQMGTRSIVVTPSINLKEQATQYLEDCFGSDMVGAYDKRFDNKPVTVLNYHAFKGIDPREWQDYNLLQIDEFHNSVSQTNRDANLTHYDNFYYRFGLTATNFTADESSSILLESVLSNVCYSITIKEAIRKGYIVPIQPIFFDISNSDVKSLKDYKKDYKNFIDNNEKRNAVILDTIKRLNDMDIPNLTLVKHIAHGQTISDACGAKFLNGQDSKAKENLLSIDDFNNGAFDSIVGTSVIGEGVNTKRCGAVINAEAGKSKKKLLQVIGRAVRKFEDKRIGYYFDFIDRRQKNLKEQTNIRMKTVEEEFGVTSQIIKIR